MDYHTIIINIIYAVTGTDVARVYVVYIAHVSPLKFIVWTYFCMQRVVSWLNATEEGHGRIWLVEEPAGETSKTSRSCCVEAVPYGEPLNCCQQSWCSSTEVKHGNVRGHACVSLCWWNGHMFVRQSIPGRWSHPRAILINWLAKEPWGSPVVVAPFVTRLIPARMVTVTPVVLVVCCIVASLLTQLNHRGTKSSLESTVYGW